MTNKIFNNSKDFSPAAEAYKDYGKYCKYPFNSSIRSRYYNFWVEERRRCLEGYSVSGDYITGYHYFYLNYCPIWLVEESTDNEELVSKVFDFPKFYDGDYKYFHYIDEAEKSGLNGVVLKSRRRGYSSKGASMLNRNYFFIPGSKSYAIAFDKQYLNVDGVISKAWEMMDFIDNNTAWTKRRGYKNQDMHRRASYKKIFWGLHSERGYRSEIIGLSLKDKPDKIRGKAGKLILFEEAGVFPDLLQAWNIALRSMRQGTKNIGLMIAFGTGGKVDKGLIGLEELFYYSGYKTLLIPNEYESEIELNKKCGFFHPASLNLQGYIDKNGNSDITEATQYILNERENLIKNSKNPIYYTKYIAEDPLKPSEALLRTTGIFFPVNELKYQLGVLMSAPNDKYKEDIGRFEINGKTGKVEFYKTDEVQPIRTYPLFDNDNCDGAVVIYEYPVYSHINNESIPYYNRYIAGCDPYAQDKSGTSSLGSFFILDILTGLIVMEYTGRPATMDIFFEQCRRALLYYNARCNYENSDKGMKTYFENKNSLYLLADTPHVIFNKVDDANIFSRGKGTPPTVNINAFGRELQKIWLLTPVEPNSEILMLHTIKSIPLLKEYIYWNKDDNFDRISALGMLFILKEDYYKIRLSQESTEQDYYEDDFWNRTYNITI